MENLTPKQKAKELVDKFDILPIHLNAVVNAAKICVDEILSSFPDCEIYDIPIENYNFWEKVKTELEKL